MQSNIKDKVVFASPKNEDERAEVAGSCVRKLGIKFPAVLDEFGNSTERAYTSSTPTIASSSKAHPAPSALNPTTSAPRSPSLFTNVPLSS